MISDCSKQFLFILPVEWGLANQHLVQQDPKSPPVHRFAIRLVVDDLRGYVVWGSTKGLEINFIENLDLDLEFIYSPNI